MLNGCAPAVTGSLAGFCDGIQPDINAAIDLALEGGEKGQEATRLLIEGIDSACDPEGRL